MEEKNCEITWPVFTVFLTECTVCYDKIRLSLGGGGLGVSLGVALGAERIGYGGMRESRADFLLAPLY